MSSAALLFILHSIHLIVYFSSAYDYDSYINREDYSDYDDLDRSKRSAIPIVTALTKSTECAEFATFCHSQDDLELLSCIYDHKDGHVSSDPTVPKTCLNKLRVYIPKFIKMSLKDLAVASCSKDWTNLDCTSRSGKGSDLAACLLEKLSAAKSEECTQFIQRLRVLPFLNGESLALFTDQCSDTVRNMCFQNQAQGGTVSEVMLCMQGSIDQLPSECREQVLFLSEVLLDIPMVYQSLAVVCEKERILYCNNLHSDDVDHLYQCLINRRDEKRLSQKCSDELYRREKIVVRDYQASRGLVKACKEDIKIHQCRKSVSNHKFVRLSQILICLENVSHAGDKLKDSCLAEMLVHRRMLMDDYRLSPELVAHCSDEIQRSCSPGDSPALVIHCLMEHSRPGKGSMSPQCQRQLEEILKETDVVENWSVDPVLIRACRDVVSVACRNTPDKNVMSCLMERLGSTVMNNECEEALLQIQYFVARDYKLDGRLFRACRQDAIRLCHAAPNWARSPSRATDPERGPLVLPCLYRHTIADKQEEKLSEPCTKEMKRIMRERALSVELHPEVEAACIQELATFCIEKTAHHQEIDCLQQNMEQLMPPCKTAIYNFTEIQAAHLELNPIIMTNCEQIINSLCKNSVENNNVGDVMECLIEHKNHQLMKYNTKCKAAVDHHQLITLNDYHFTLKFKEACQIHVSRYCSGATTKAQVVACLSEVMRNDTLTDSKQKITKECRQQVRAQLLQAKENINYNPSLKADCSKDIDKFCHNVPHGNAKVLECLELHRKQLSKHCHNHVFQIERDDLIDSSTDYKLWSTCKDMIKKYCMTTDNPLPCLKKHKYELDFDAECRLVIIQRMIEQFSDIRLNDALHKGCRKDIAQHCVAVVADVHMEEKYLLSGTVENELNGKVISCLKNKFRERKLLPECQKNLIELLQETALNYQLNPLLTSLCKQEIERLCQKEMKWDQLGGGNVEECLKRSLVDKELEGSPQCKAEVVELIRERKADIEADPTLHTACLHDLKQYCSQEPKGDSRQLNCLVAILESRHNLRTLQAGCKVTLSQRLEMYKVLGNITVESFHDLYTHVSRSPSKKYFFVIAISFAGMLFMSGLFCGRLVRRSHMAVKNK